MEDRVSATKPDVLKSILFVDPSVVSFLNLQCEDDEEFEDLRISLESDTKTWIFFPVSDNQSFDAPSSHWSTLLCHRPTASLLHYDSLGGRNLGAAQRLADKIARLLSWSTPPSVSGYAGPKQSNGSDCGVYAALFCRFVCDNLCQSSSSTTSTGGTSLSLRSLSWLAELADSVNPAAATEFRRAIRADIRDAAARFGQRQSDNLLESIRLSGSSNGGPIGAEGGFQGIEFRPLPPPMHSIAEDGGDEDDADEYGLDQLPEDV